MPARLMNLPAVVRCQVFEACLSKRSFSISSKVSGHENPLVSGHLCDSIAHANDIESEETECSYLSLVLI